MKKLMMKGMHMIMLDCDQATYLASKSEIVKLGCTQRMQLKMHLFSCKLCKNFVKQSKIIDEQVNKLKAIDDKNLLIHLTEKQKAHLDETVKGKAEKIDAR